ncbi:hypothetical protein OEZ86_004347 [Tetradesmus obliquus]|nr:hypothetical protein OEZ86_004347 [Tetradesmus obliquus]
MVQFKHSAAPPWATISGVLTVRNPNLLGPILLAQAQVELSTPGGTGLSARAWASCPRDASGYASMSGQLTINLAMASPTTGQGDLAAAAGTVMEFSGCPGAPASMNFTALQLQMLKAAYWSITGQIAAGSSIKEFVGSTLVVSFGLRYTATAEQGVRQMIGAVSVRSVGKAALQVSQLLLDVTPLDAATAARGSLVPGGPW